MFKNNTAFSGFSVPDLAEAKKFYSEVLGLDVRERPEGLELHLKGGAQIFIYPSPSNKPAAFTILNFIVDDINAAVGELHKKGVEMEHYDMPGIKTDAQGIARGEEGPQAMAWFKDPAGNILGVMQEK